MKIFFSLAAVWILCGAGAFGQAIGSGNGMAQMLIMTGNPQQATQTPLAAEQDLRERSTSTYARGEKPLWEVMPEARILPLGDLARALKKEHAAAKKAVVVWTN